MPKEMFEVDEDEDTTQKPEETTEKPEKEDNSSALKEKQQKLAEQLNGLKDPDFANSDELTPLTNLRLEVGKLLGGSSSEKDLGDAELLLAGAPQALELVKTSVSKRFETEKQRLSNEADKVKAPPGSTSEEELAIATAAGLVKSTVGGALTPEILLDADNKLTTAQQLVTKTELAVNGRKEKQQKLAQQLNGIKDPDHANSGELTPLTNLRSEAGKLLEGTPGDKDLETAESILNGAPQVIESVKEAVTKRFDTEKQQLTNEADKIKAPVGSSSEEELAITNAAELVKTTVSGTLTPDILLDGTKKLKTAQELVTTTELAVKSRKEKQEKLAEQLKGLKDPDYATATELTPLTNLRSDAGKFLEGTPGDKDLEKAESLLKGSPQVIESVKQAVALRFDTEKQRLSNEADKIKAPAGSTSQEELAITTAAGLVKSTVGGALTPEILIDGRNKLQTAQELVTNTELAVKDRAGKRLVALKKCTAVADPAGANPTQTQRMTVQRKKVTDLLPKPPITDKQLLDAEKEQLELEKLATTIKSEVTERAKYETRLLEVTKLVNASVGSVGTAGEAFLTTALGNAKNTGDTATDASGWQKAVVALTKLSNDVPVVISYYEKHDALVLIKGNYTSTEPSNTEKARLEGIITAAEVLATNKDFPGAKAKLLEFTNDLNVKEVGEFYTELDNLRSNSGEKLAKLKSNPPPTNKPLHLKPDIELKAIKDPCIGTTDKVAYATAKTKMTAFKKRIDDSYEYTELYDELLAFKNGATYGLLDPTEKSTIDTALSNAKAKADNPPPGDPAAAITELKSGAVIGPKITEPTAAAKSSGEAHQLYDALKLLSSAGAPTLHVKGLLDAADLELTGKKFKVAEGLFNSLIPVCRDAIGYVEQLAKAESIYAGTATTEAKPDVLKLGKDQAATNDFKGATPLLVSGLETLKEFAAYDGRLTTVKELKSTLPSTSLDEISLIDEVIKDAGTLATSAKYVEAKAALDALSRVPELAEADKNLTTYLEKHEELKSKRQAPLAALELTEAKDFLNLFWTEAEDFALNKKYKEAVGKLNDLEAAIGPALKFARERAGVKVVNKQLEDLNTAGKNAYAPPTVTKDTLLASLTAADVAAKKGDFATGFDKCTEFRLAARAICKTVAQNHDANEGTANVHPHSYAKHLNSTDTDRENRVKTGVPDPLTRSASGFDDAESWLATHALSQEKGATQPGVNLSMNNSTPVTDKTKIAVYIEHGRPIGSSMVGMQEKQVALGTGSPNKGETKGSGTYDRAVKVTGFTRTVSIYQFDATEGTDGKWVLLTQYPYTNDWDAERGCYTKPIPG